MTGADSGLTHTSSPSFSVVVLPFLKTSGPVVLGGLTIRSTLDTNGLPSNQEQAVAELRDMLYLQDDYQLESASYAIVPGIDFTRRVPRLPDLESIQAVIAFRYAAPHPTSGDLF